ncbi:50S ribosomal protein L21 [Candidatus Uhrbacteria bacterium]|nr:50S ribosomal protein L21 [Candidatus Uhrbacteria bacterium]
MIRVIRTGGKQYLVKTGDQLKVEKLPGESGARVTVDVLLEANNELTETPTIRLGSPVVGSTTVTISGQRKGPKVEVVKFKRKVRYHRRKGHRQLVSDVTVQ